MNLFSLNKKSTKGHRMIPVFFVMMMLVLFAFPAFAQQDVSGTITDVSGEPLIGVNVVVKGTTIGTISDLNGKFVLNVPKSDDILVFSYIGYLTVEEKTGTRTSINVVLKDDSQALEEVVVVGYGVQKKVTVTGSVASVQGDELKSSATSNITNAMVGRMPGVIGFQKSDEPGGGGTTIRIRGTNSLGSNDPLVVIDGVPGRAGGLDRLNPNEIESMSVLKDASAAIYGSRAANGVILVTTKRGKEGKPTVTYQGMMGFSKPTSLPDVCNATQYAEMVNDINMYRNDEAKYSAEDLQKFSDGSDPWGHPNTNWYDESIKDYSPMYRHDLGVSGGSDKFKFYLNMAANGEDGIYKNSANRYDQFSVRANLDAKINEYISLSYSNESRMENRQYPTKSAYDIFMALVRSKPTEPGYWPNGDPGPDIEYGDNPVVTGTDATGYDREKSYYLQNTLKATVKIPWIEGLSLVASGSYDKYFTKRKKFTTPWTLYSCPDRYDDVAVHVTVPGQRGPATPELTQEDTDVTDWMANAVLNYNHSFGDHNIGITAGIEAQDKDNIYYDAFRRYFISSKLDILDAGGESEKTNSGNGYEESRLNYFGRLSYNYLERYLLEFVWRYDGSYRFPKGERYGFFPGVSAAWRASEEDFWKENLSFINYFKLRASISQTGNDALVDDDGNIDHSIQYLNTYGFGTDYLFNNDFQKTLSQTRTPNRSITWEVGTTYNLGFDLKFLNNRLSLESDLFYHKRTDMLIYRNASLPEISGISLPKENLGEMHNQGIEAMLGWNDKVNDFQYDASVNVTYAKNKIDYWDETPGVPEWQKSTGHKANTSLYYVADGVFNDQAELDAYPHWTNARTGDIKFKDIDGNGKIDGDDRVRSDKNYNPDLVFGVNLGATWKNFDIKMLFQGALGGETYVWRERAGLAGNFYTFMYEDRWTPTNTLTENPRTYNRSDEYWVQNENTYYLKNTDYIRFKNVELGYTFDFPAIHNVGISNLRVFANATNLFTIDAVKVQDPESDSTGESYPQRQTMNFGLSVTF